jgi:hypothetical protein
MAAAYTFLRGRDEYHAFRSRVASRLDIPENAIEITWLINFLNTLHYVVGERVERLLGAITLIVRFGKLKKRGAGLQAQNSKEDELVEIEFDYEELVASYLVLRLAIEAGVIENDITDLPRLFMESLDKRVSTGDNSRWLRLRGDSEFVSFAELRETLEKNPHFEASRFEEDDAPGLESPDFASLLERVLSPSARIPFGMAVDEVSMFSYYRLLDRAVREGTHNRLHVRRQIALGVVYYCSSRSEQEMSAERHVAQAVEFQRREVAAWRAQLSERQKMNLPELAVSSARGHLEREEEILRCLSTNRSWLIGMLSK